MNGFGKVGRSARRSSHRSVSIFEAIRYARLLMGESDKNKSSTILQKDWQRNDKAK